MAIAWKVCATGFANLSSLVRLKSCLSLTWFQDDGFFGKGIYFTTYALYALPYFSTKSDPAVILSFVLPGCSFPVIEHTEGKDSLVGYVVTNLRKSERL